MANKIGQRRVPADYKIACICPMGVELAPVEGMLDEIHDPLQVQRDQNAYTLGSIGEHNIVIAIMPEIGNNAAATTVTQLLNDFPAIRFGLLVGIGGGVPGEEDVRLGDVVVGQPAGTFPGVVQYDMGKELEDGRFQRTGSLNKPPAVLSASVRKLDGQHRRIGHDLSGHILVMGDKYPTMQKLYSFPTTARQDQLFHTSYRHQSGPTCDHCDDQYIVSRPDRLDNEPRIHYGTIGSANRVVKDANIRDRTRADTNALCVEMEAAGLMSDFPCLVIRGICDYADSHKNKKWQPYAAATAAAYMKALLLIIPVQEVSPTGHAVEVANSPFKLGLHLTEAPVIGDDLFVDRATEIQEMERALEPTSPIRKHRRLVLGGMGGIGKTQLAIAYAKRHCDLYDSTFWLNAASETVLKQSIRLMAQRVLDVEQYSGLNDDRILLYTTRWLLDPKNTQWLLVFDNYDDPDTYDIGKYCPYGAHGSAIITTRLPDQVRGQQLLIRSLKGMEQGLSILATRSKRADAIHNPHALDLVKRLQGLPLALATAGAFLKHSPWTYKEYLETYEKQFNVDVHRSSDLPEYRNRTLYTTWDMTYVRLEGDYPRAARLLRTFAFFDNQHLQHKLFSVRNDHSMVRKSSKKLSRFRSLFRAHTDKNRLGWLPPMSTDEFESAMHVLTEYCFVEVRSMEGDYSVHSCVHDWALSSLNGSTRSDGYWFAFDQIADLVGSIDKESYAFSKYSAITPHAVRLSHISFSTIDNHLSRERLLSMHEIGDFLRSQLQVDAAEHIYRRVLAAKEKAFGLEDTSTLTTVNNLGRVYRMQVRLTEAEQMYERAIAGYTKALGPEHMWTLTVFENLGHVYIGQGKLVEAEQIYLQALTRRENALGLEHSLTLNTVRNLGYLYRDQGKLTEAEQLCKRALVGQEKLFGPEHTETLETVNQIGILYCRQNMFVEAEQAYHRALAGQEKLLGPDHLSTLMVVNNFGSLYSKQDKLVEAEQAYRRSLAGKEKVLRPNDTSLLTTVNNLGHVYHKQGRLLEAEQMYQRAMTQYDQAAFSVTIPALRCVFDQGLLHKDQGKLTEAARSFQRAADGYGKMHGPEHTDTIRAVKALHDVRQSLAGKQEDLEPEDSSITTLEERSSQMSTAIEGAEESLFSVPSVSPSFTSARASQTAEIL